MERMDRAGASKVAGKVPLHFGRESLLYLAGLLLLVLAWQSPVLFPLRIFVVFLHELSHGLAAEITGGELIRISLSSAEGGEALTRGGNAFLILSAGYLGSLLWGGFFLQVARTRWAQLVLIVLGFLMMFFTLAYVRSVFGVIFCFAFGVAALTIGRYLPLRFSSLSLALIGMVSCFYAPLDIWSDVLGRPELDSDARALAEMTGIPTLVWGVLWLVVALLFSAWLFHRLWKQMRRARMSGALEAEDARETNKYLV